MQRKNTISIVPKVEHIFLLYAVSIDYFLDFMLSLIKEVQNRYSMMSI